MRVGLVRRRHERVHDAQEALFGFDEAVRRGRDEADRVEAKQRARRPIQLRRNRLGHLGDAPVPLPALLVRREHDVVVLALVVVAVLQLLCRVRHDDAKHAEHLVWLTVQVVRHEDTQALLRQHRLTVQLAHDERVARRAHLLPQRRGIFRVKVDRVLKLAAQLLEEAQDAPRAPAERLEKLDDGLHRVARLRLQLFVLELLARLLQILRHAVEHALAELAEAHGRRDLAAADARGDGADKAPLLLKKVANRERAGRRAALPLEVQQLEVDVHRAHDLVAERVGCDRLPQVERADEVHAVFLVRARRDVERLVDVADHLGRVRERHLGQMLPLVVLDAQVLADDGRADGAELHQSVVQRRQIVLHKGGDDVRVRQARVAQLEDEPE
eukprot:Unigene769_Nuclearia_a/m.2483 Unigene769_Nuclearia_a/g.2483  ORF Unigene769_Nuclearia_a/g.2483 Unigene769_Nuclearia_a/m.2483 type:complete len:386 (+) Unigene769_Nuclearia_a:1934-3091(+)